MSIHTGFHKYMTSSDYATNADGASSVAFHADSTSELYMALDTDHVYHVTGLTLSETVTAKLTTVTLETIDDSGITAGSQFDTDVTAVLITPSIFHSYTVNVTPSLVHVPFNPPIKVQYSSTSAFLTVRIASADSDGVPGVSYSGFTTPAP